MLLVIDNYDSFTYNLVQYLLELGQELEIRRNDKISVDEVRSLDPSAIVISPGPCGPGEAGISVELVQAALGRIPLLGVCLGHQVLAAATKQVFLDLLQRQQVYQIIQQFAHSASSRDSQPLTAGTS